MPEGDTLYKTAARLRPALLHQPLTKVTFTKVKGPDRLRVGDVVSAVESVGKYLEIAVERGAVLRTHLRMTGSWHLYRTGERWRKPARYARVVLETDEWVAVCFSAPVIEVGRVGDGRLDHLGPDLCRPDVDLDTVVERSAAYAEPATSIAEVLLDQVVAAGIGNVYKSETLWACSVDPFAPIETVAIDARRRLYDTAHRLLLANLDGGDRVTVPGGLAVYGRQGSGCRRCGTPIRMRRHGEQRRSTYWCPTCQPPTPHGAGRADRP